ncbi:hypothetical protein AAFF_G00414540 [Aldrovandia affinis]|uniref:Hepatic sodium/bile acid cotransporter n=1 Tax=Aldrovandia affinis TaxID=143900 RepID=A0AAD7WJL3_9TELE|nr:hypothetical protein AAFF_G00414540 [Aldrovandia affinis]
MAATINQTEWLYSGSNDIGNYGNHYNVTPHNSTLEAEVFNPVIDKVLSGLSIVTLFITMVALGCSMEITKIKAHIKKPKGVVIAVVAQFGIMPLAAFALAKIFQLGSLEAVTLLICGCCPGGNLSNIFTLALDGDMNLSIVMTTCSTILALGMMPLLLFLYCQGIESIGYNMPYTGIIIALLLTLFPCAIGIAINHWAPQYSSIVQKVSLVILLNSAVAIGIISGISIGTSIWSVLSPQIMATASLLPMIGFMLGYILSTLFRLPEACRRTVAMETGCQNIQLCSTILKVTFPIEVIGALFLFPVVYILFQIIESLILITIYRCYKRFKPAAVEKTVYMVVDGKAEEVKIP